MSIIIFLDIDGVFKDPKNHDLWYEDSIDKFNNAVSILNAKIVISSSWRLVEGKDFFNNLFNNRVVGFTEDLSVYNPQVIKEEECLRYIKKHNIKDYVFIDDNEYEFPNMRNKLIKTDAKIGFDNSNLENLLSLKEKKSLKNKVKI